MWLVFTLSCPLGASLPSPAACNDVERGWHAYIDDAAQMSFPHLHDATICAARDDPRVCVFRCAPQPLSQRIPQLVRQYKITRTARDADNKLRLSQPGRAE